MNEPCGWFDLRGASSYCSLSVNTLRRYIGDVARPLPVRVVGGKLLIRRTDLDTWLASFPRAGEDVDRMVEEVLSDIQGGTKHAQKR